MSPLLQAFSGTINKSANRYIQNPKFPLHPEVIRNQFKIQALKAFETFDPNRGVQLNTHVTNMMRKATRYLIRHQNIGVVPEVRALKARDFLEGRAQVAERLGREPNQLELSQHLKWSPAEVRRMEREMRQSSPTAQWEDEPTGLRPSREAEVIQMIQYELSGEERLVYEYLFGIGKPQMQPGQIATRLVWTPSKVTRIKNKILAKIDQYL